MKPHRNLVVQYVAPAGPERELLERIDDVVARALSGDACALSAVVVTFGAALIAVARRELGVLWESEAEDVVQDVYRDIALGTYTSAAVSLDLGEGLPWLRRKVRERAWEQPERRWRDAWMPTPMRRWCRW
jgi:DNA-directed RNA polymerase specialized sigma24 family protein